MATPESPAPEPPDPSTAPPARERAPDAAAERPMGGGAPPGDRIDLADADAAQRWCEHFGITREQLEEAVRAAGDAPAAVREHLLNQGASAGAG